MKKIILILLVTISITSLKVKAQFYARELLRVETKTILTENYSQINLPAITAKGKNLNRYDSNNPDTYIELLEDIHHSKSHILLQVDFFGNIHFVAVSNNIFALVIKKDKPRFIFDQCLADLNNGFSSPQENITKLVYCILERLGVSSQK